ncbi:sn-1-specific diacylglycerol lipase ABHD11 isoform X2 [Drosophila takahashii]|uniref:sn-1-specific diacylglycerol lipase ABHD11 isoform X2 n=1 Tax=Drosophila takahashii TaxID=29030 RepID=UPI0038990C9B
MMTAGFYSKTIPKPELVERLIVVDISPISVPRSTGEMTQIFDAMVSLDLSPTLSMSEGRKIAREKLLKATEDETVDFIMLNLRKDPKTGVFSWACNARVLRDFLTRFDNYQSNLEKLPPYTGPTTFICGSRSPYMRREQWPQIVEMFPNSEIHWLEAGHLVHFEQPQEFLTLVSEFLNRSD